MDSIECLDAFVTDNPIDMEVKEEDTNYINVDPLVLMLREEGTYWEPLAIVEATTELKNWAGEGVVLPVEESVRKIKSATFAKKIKTAELVTPTRNVVFVLIESIFASVSIPVKSVCDSFPIESVEFVEFVKNSFPSNMISDSAYLLALNVFIFEIGKKTLNNKELKHGYLEPIKK